MKQLHCMMDLQGGEEIIPKTWFIDKEDALTLINSIKKDKENPPPFNVLGKNSVFTGSSAAASNKERGHSCFTYCKEKIENLNVSTIILECSKTASCMEHIIGITYLTLPSSGKN